MYYTCRVTVANKFKIVECYQHKRIFPNVVFYYYCKYFCTVKDIVKNKNEIRVQSNR